MRSLLLWLVVLAAPSFALAQSTCPPGLAPVDDAHCCWPGQAFAADRQVCAGAPRCPAGMVANGETCAVAPAYAVPPPPPVPDLPPPPPMPAAALAIGYPAHFEARRDDKFTVTLDSGESCQTPCDLSVPAGKQRIKITGDGSFSESLVFPAGPSAVQIEKRRGGCIGLAITGLAVGIPMAMVGLALTMAAVVVSAVPTTSDGQTHEDQGLLIGGIVVTAAGVTFAAVGAGVGFGTAGHNRARFESARTEKKDEEVSLIFTGVGAAPTRGGAVVGASFAF